MRELALAVFSGEFDLTIGPLLAGIKRAVEAFEPDTTTAKGRDEIRSFAFKLCAEQNRAGRRR